MTTIALRSSLLRHHFIWALWLALLLPAAQTVAAAHSLSHTSAASADAQDLHSAHCSLCLAAAALASAVAPGPLPELPVPAAIPTALPMAGHSFDSLPARLAYQSRAPPASPR